MALRCIPRVARATQRSAAPRFFSSELTPEQKENDAILKSMERMREKADMVSAAVREAGAPTCVAMALRRRALHY